MTDTHTVSLQSLTPIRPETALQALCDCGWTSSIGTSDVVSTAAAGHAFDLNGSIGAAVEQVVPSPGPAAGGGA